MSARRRRGGAGRGRGARGRARAPSCAPARDRGRELGAELDRLTDSVHRGEVLGAEQRLRIEQLETKALEELGVEPAGLVAEYGPDQLVPPSPPAEDERAPRSPSRAAAALRPRRAGEAAEGRRAGASAARQGQPAGPGGVRGAGGAAQVPHRAARGPEEDPARPAQVVKEVDERVEQVFTEAYQDTAREFEGVFARLFPGGEGRLVLTDPDDMLTTGVEVEARPPGKKVKRLSLLSGGERSLTAVALLVAIFKARPSPFYVMDEVEAALDDTNLRRLLRHHARSCGRPRQLIVDHAPEAHDGGRRRAVRRLHAGRRRHQGRSASGCASPSRPDRRRPTSPPRHATPRDRLSASSVDCLCPGRIGVVALLVVRPPSCLTARSATAGARRPAAGARHAWTTAPPSTSGRSVDVPSRPRRAGRDRRPRAAAGRLVRLRARLARPGSPWARACSPCSPATPSTTPTWDEVEETLLVADLGVAADPSSSSGCARGAGARHRDAGRACARCCARSCSRSSTRTLDRSLRTTARRPARPSSWWSASTAPARPPPAASSPGCSSPRTHGACSARPTRSAPPRPTSSQTWGERVGAEVVRGPEGGDPASVAFDAVRQGDRARAPTSSIIDTAGRLHTKTGLMDELGKVKRVVEKQRPVDEVLLVLDATTGQNGLPQARVFAEVVDVTGIVLTKLDGTAKGGIVVAVQRELGVPVKLVGPRGGRRRPRAVRAGDLRRRAPRRLTRLRACRGVHLTFT